MAIVTFLFNLTMLRLLGEDGVAAITIVLYGQFLFTSMYLGFSMGVAPVFSFNYGDKNYDQLKRIYKSLHVLHHGIFYCDSCDGACFCRADM